MLQLQHRREMRIMRDGQHGGGRIDVGQRLLAIDDEKLAVSCEHVVAGFPYL